MALTMKEIEAMTGGKFAKHPNGALVKVNYPPGSDSWVNGWVMRANWHAEKDAHLYAVDIGIAELGWVWVWEKDIKEKRDVIPQPPGPAPEHYGDW